jgi:hypothetical protein
VILRGRLPFVLFKYDRRGNAGGLGNLRRDIRRSADEGENKNREGENKVTALGTSHEHISPLRFLLGM